MSKKQLCLFVCLILSSALNAIGDDKTPFKTAETVFLEKDGVLAVEAEHYRSQEKHDVRKWTIKSTFGSKDPTWTKKEPLLTASAGSYLSLLPDTRRTHADKLIHGQNFSNEPGKLAILNYRVKITNPGRYYVWVRAFSTGTEDNGIHVGLNGEWPESGQRMQWCAGKHQWWWESKQRTAKEHCGVPHQIFLDIEKAGEHTISFSMREDGFKFDRWLITKDRNMVRPNDAGPPPCQMAGPSPIALQEAAAKSPHTAEHSHASLPEANANNRKADGDGSVTVSGELKLWHTVTISLNGPFGRESVGDVKSSRALNPYTNYWMAVNFEHESGESEQMVHGYFAADGNAAESSAKDGTTWRAHFRPNRTGKWTYWIYMHLRDSVTGKIRGPLNEYQNIGGKFEISPSDKTGRDFRARGRLQYVGKRYLQFAGSKQYFLKAGPDAPETLLAYKDFDDTIQRSPKGPLKSWDAHVNDWREGDPTWKDGKGKGLIGAVNYLAGKGVNAMSFLPYNAGGDGDNVWPYTTRDNKFSFDCSKLDQWNIVFEHATNNGIFLHFKLQETEMDDNRRGHKDPKNGNVPTSLDGGDLGPERKLYLREMIARFGHHLALNWNLGEENTQSPEQQRAMAKYIRETDPYNNHIVIHTYPDQQDKVYPPLLGEKSALTGASLQNPWNVVHQRTLKWIKESQKASKPWVVCNDEQNPAGLGVPPDPGFEGHSGIAEQHDRKYDLHDIRKQTLWGNLMAGGAGVEYYFGYKLPQNDLICEDFRSRDKSWDYCRIALQFFQQNNIPIDQMTNANHLIGNAENANGKFCLAKDNAVYLVYLANGGDCQLDLSKATGEFELRWFNPRNGQFQPAKQSVKANEQLQLTAPDQSDWLGVIRR